MNKTTALAIQTCTVLAAPALADAARPGDDFDRDATVAALHAAAHSCSTTARRRRVEEPGADLLLLIVAELRRTAVQVGWDEPGWAAAASNRLTFVAGVARTMLAVLGTLR